MGMTAAAIEVLKAKALSVGLVCTVAGYAAHDRVAPVVGRAVHRVLHHAQGGHPAPRRPLPAVVVPATAPCVSSLTMLGVTPYAVAESAVTPLLPVSLGRVPVDVPLTSSIPEPHTGPPFYGGGFVALVSPPTAPSAVPDVPTWSAALIGFGAIGVTMRLRRYKGEKA